MDYHTYPAGTYSFHTVASPTAEARIAFDDLPGTLCRRKITLNYVDPAKIVNLHQRPEYSPIINLFQLKKNEDQLAVYVQSIFVSNPFLESLETFLRAHAVDVPADRDEQPPEQFRTYYDTDFTLIPCDVERIEMTKITPAGKFRVIEHLGTTDIFRGVDMKAGLTLRMVEPSVLESKLQEIEADASYTASIITSPENKRVPWFHEHKEGREHYIFKRE